MYGKRKGLKEGWKNKDWEKDEKKIRTSEKDVGEGWGLWKLEEDNGWG